MPQTTSRKLAAGNRDSYLGFYDASTGLFIGGSSTAPAAGQASGMVELLGIREVNLTTPEPTNVPDPGDDTVLANFQFDNDAVRAYIATMAVQDQQLDAYLQSTFLQTIGGTTWGIADVLNAPELACVLLHQSRAKYFDPSNRGRKAWESKLVPNASVRPLNRTAMSGRTVAEYRLAITENLAAATPWGVTYTNDSGTWGNDSPYYMDGRGDYPVHYVNWSGNGVLVIIPLDHVPVSVAYCAAWYNQPGQQQGTPLTVSAVSVANKTATVSLAIPAGAVGTIQYGYARK